MLKFERAGMLRSYDLTNGLIKSPIYPPYLGGVWMVGVRGYIGPQFLGFVYTVYIIRLVVKQKIEISEKKLEIFDYTDSETITPIRIRFTKR